MPCDEMPREPVECVESRASVGLPELSQIYGSYTIRNLEEYTVALSCISRNEAALREALAESTNSIAMLSVEWLRRQLCDLKDACASYLASADLRVNLESTPTADSRTCDFAQVKSAQVLRSSLAHINDVRKAVEVFVAKLRLAAFMHDSDKIEHADEFYAGFSGGFVDKAWLESHYTTARHHLKRVVPPDVNLLDVLEMIADCVTAGMARSGSVYSIELPSEVLQKAVANTVEMLKALMVTSTKKEETK